ncbi:hypothetical protein [Thermus sp. NEB1569]|uniref:hypothetical protein n=1 Tax=Thermus sp. NEB1569 TaxID=2918899 RepID=UPI001EFA8FD2|nr:hypothetical protein [Thermus sp. NEB1569]ULR41546.1 hypothetical protein MI302_04580 [Thermus sp. NEB1569]
MSTQVNIRKGGNKNEEKEDQCNAGQKAEVVYIRIPKENRPALLPDLKEGKPVFQVLSYERR